MEKVVFIVHSNYYSLELLNNYVERNTDCRAFNFFRAEEMLLYLNLRPDVIIYGQEEYKFDKKFLEKISEKSPNSVFMGVGEDFIRVDFLAGGELILEDIHPYRDIYQDLHKVCYTVQSI